MSWYGYWKPYVPVATRQAKAARYAAKLAKKEGRELAPVETSSSKIATSFWGQAWCQNLERYSDFDNRLPRGRTYLRNGSVVDLQIKRGLVKAIVAGSEVYTVTIKIKTLDRSRWDAIRTDCARSVPSLMDLLQGKFDRAVMERLTRRDDGLFPQPREISLDCTCADWADMCKHVAAVLYGVGVRLDSQPELLFTLRDVDHLDLISQALSAENLDQALSGQGEGVLPHDNLSELFGIELDSALPGTAESAPAESPKPSRRSKKAPAVDRAPSVAKAAEDAVTPPGGNRRKAARTGAGKSRPVKTSAASADKPKSKAPAAKPRRGAKAR